MLLGREQPSLSPHNRDIEARRIIQRDENEADNDYGQRVSKIFHYGDLFIDGSSEQTIFNSVSRFIEAFFGKNKSSPTKDELGSFFAKSASLRSVDLSRQVGAAILSQEGEIITVGCNEVPKPGGGNYWDDDEPKHRDIDLGGEANKEETNRIIHDFIDLLYREKLLKRGYSSQTILSNPKLREKIMDSLIGEITEYGRMVHA